MMDMKTLRELFDDDDLVRKYLVRFTEDMPGLIRLMRKACDSHQWDELSIHAHSYKSQLQYINEAEAAAMAYDIEQRSTGPSPEKERIANLIQALDDHLASVLPALKKITG